jgi:hypothetical protein
MALKPGDVPKLAFYATLLLFAIASNVNEAISVCLEPAKVGNAGAQFHRVIVDHKVQIQISDLKATSPLAARHFRDGDTIVLDHPWDDLRMFRAGEVIGLGKSEAGGTSRVEVAVPAAQPATLGQRIALNLNFLANLPLLLVSLFMLWRSKGDRGITALALAFACNGAASPYRWPLPAAAYPVWYVVLNTGFALIPWFLLYFAMNYYERTTRPLTAREKHAFRGLVALQLVLFTLDSLGTLQFFKFPVFGPVGIAHNICQALGFIISFWYLRKGFRSTNLDQKKRYALLLVALVGAFFPDIVFIVTSYIANPFRFHSLSLVSIVSWASQIAGSLLFTYAIFRHKVLDVGFAINRTLVYATVTVILLAAFSLIEWAVENIIHVQGRVGSASIDAAVAVGVSLSFKRVSDFVERHIEALFFRDWHLNERQLSEFVTEARFVTKQQALYSALAQELVRFCGGAGSAVYARSGNGDFMLIEANGIDPPERLDADEPMLVKLRARSKALELESSTLPGGAVLALPMVHRSDLLGLSLVAAKPLGDSYRPDEIQALADAVHQVGLDLYALNVEALETEAAELRTTNAVLERKYAKLSGALRATLAN